jgi:hypothetical protein
VLGRRGDWPEMDVVLAHQFQGGNVPAMMELSTVAKAALAALETRSTATSPQAPSHSMHIGEPKAPQLCARIRKRGCAHLSWLDKARNLLPDRVIAVQPRLQGTERLQH